MIFSNKTFTLLIFCGIIISSAYAFVTANEHITAGPEASTPTQGVKDTTRKPAPAFPIKKYTQNTYEELNTKYPMDAPNPNNVKSVV